MATLVLRASVAHTEFGWSEVSSGQATDEPEVRHWVVHLNIDPKSTKYVSGSILS
jgi:hypothetical protein